MIPWNRLLPRFRLQHLPILQQLTGVLVVEIVLVGSHLQMAAPHQRASLERKSTLRLATHGTSFGMRVIAFIRQTLEIRLLAPRILVSILAVPMHGRLLPRFVTFHCPLSGPRESFAFDVAALLHCFRRSERRSRGSVYGYNWKHEARSSRTSQFERGCHCIWSRQHHRPQCI